MFPAPREWAEAEPPAGQNQFTGNVCPSPHQTRSRSDRKHQQWRDGDGGGRRGGRLWLYNPTDRTPVLLLKTLGKTPSCEQVRTVTVNEHQRGWWISCDVIARNKLRRLHPAQVHTSAGRCPVKTEVLTCAVVVGNIFINACLILLCRQESSLDGDETNQWLI